MSSLSVQDAQAMWGIPSSANPNDLQRLLDAIEVSIERVLGGPVISRQFVERVELTDFASAILLRKRPVVSVASIVAVSSGAAISVSDLDIDTNSGIVRRTLGLPFTIGRLYPPVVTVTYTAGLGSTAPADIQEAEGIILKHLWESRLGGGTGPMSEQLVNIPRMPYAIPNRAAELLAPRALEAFV
jgi:hypothetical protein